MNSKLRFPALLLLGMMVVSAGGCFSSSSSSDPGNNGDDGGATVTAQVRAFHASPDAGAVDVYVDGERVLDDVSYPAASPYLEVPVAELQVQIVPAGEAVSEAVIDELLTPVEDGRYSFVVWGSADAGSLTASVLDDGTEETDAGFIRIRPAHLAVGAPAVDLYVTAQDADLATATPVASDLAFGDIADDYIETEAEVSRLRVTAAGTTNVIYDYLADFPQFDGATLLAAALNADAGFSPILIGAATGSDTLPFLPLVDQQAEVRVAHGSPDAGPVDVEVSLDEGMTWLPLVEDLVYFNHSGYIRVLGELDYDVRVSSSDTGNVVDTLELSPVPGEAYTVFALGSIQSDSLTFLPTTDRAAPAESGSFALRAVHGILGGPTVDVTADGAVLIDELAAAEASDFLEAAPASIDVEVVTSTGGDNVIGPLTVDFESSVVYTAVALPETEAGAEENTLWLITDRIDN